MSNSNLFLNMKLPRNLNNSEIKEYFIKYSNGDKEARDALILHNLKLVLYRIHTRFNDFPFDMEEMFSIGVIGLINSIDTFDIEKETTFSVYAVKCIDNAILMYARKETKQLGVDRLDQPLAIDKDGKELTIEETLCDDSVDLIEDYETKDQIRILKILMNDLSDKELEILHLYFADRYTQQEIANQYHISRSAISAKINRITEKLANGFEHYNEAKHQNQVKMNDNSKIKKKCSNKEKM